jgi:TPR repeat protein
VPQDKREAARWYKMAAKQGNEKAQEGLRRLSGKPASATPNH